MDWENLESSSFRVEISGWDSGESFFVERADLTWDPDGGKEACVQNVLKQGSVVFIRLLQPLSRTAALAIASTSAPNCANSKTKFASPQKARIALEEALSTRPSLLAFDLNLPTQLS